MCRRRSKGSSISTEIDKIAKKDENPSIIVTFPAKACNSACFKILEARWPDVPPQGGRKHPHPGITPVIRRTFVRVRRGFRWSRKKSSRARGPPSLGFHTDATPTTPQAAEYRVARARATGDLIRYG